MVLVTVTAKDNNNNSVVAKDKDDLVLRMWTNSDSSSDIVTSQHPLAVYVSVTRHGLVVPVTHATVTLTIHARLTTADNVSSVSVTSLPPIQLLDNGNGDPDMVANDGVYSRYVTRYPGVGRYTFTVTATSSIGGGEIVKEDDDMGDSYSPPANKSNLAVLSLATAVCCGSQVRLFSDLKTTVVTPFRRVLEGRAINLLAVPLAGERDRLSPSRIGDLRLRVLVESGSLSATWTAPGDDFDEGAVSGYRYSGFFKVVFKGIVSRRFNTNLRSAFPNSCFI